MICGPIMAEARLGFTFKLWNDSLGQDLSELDPPLVKRIDVPYRALSENVVLIKSDQLAKYRGREFLREDGI